MVPPSTPPDELMAHLNELRVPTAHTAQVARIMAHARTHPRRGWQWLQWLRQLRAYLYLPQMRYVVMACMVGFFIVIGLASPHKAPPLTPDELLQDITFDEEDPLKGFWTAGL